MDHWLSRRTRLASAVKANSSASLRGSQFTALAHSCRRCQQMCGDTFPQDHAELCRVGVSSVQFNTIHEVGFRFQHIVHTEGHGTCANEKQVKLRSERSEMPNLLIKFSLKSTERRHGARGVGQGIPICSSTV